MIQKKKKKPFIGNDKLLHFNKGTSVNSKVTFLLRVFQNLSYLEKSDVFQKSCSALASIMFSQKKKRKGKLKSYFTEEITSRK